MDDRDRGTRGRVVRFPISYSQRRRNEMGPGYVPCVVSGRWLQFPKKSDGRFGGGEFISISVMTDVGEGARKLCDLIITREDLVRAIGSVAEPEQG